MHHQPILVDEFLEFFAHSPLRIFVDGTVGAGGHAAALLNAHSEVEVFYGLDRDPDALKIFGEILESFENKIRLLRGNFRDVDLLIPEHEVSGIFLDLGVSSMQLDRPEKGFSFSHEGPLDMRMDPASFPDAAHVVNTLSEKALADLFWKYGEEPRSRRVAKAIVEGRKKKKFHTTTDLCTVLKPVLTWGGRMGKKIHPFTLVFQALRIFVNDELGGLEEALPKALEKLSPGGRLGVLSFHSLEDRIVKQTFRRFLQEGRAVVLTKKPIEPTDEEVRKNPRARCAKMRFLEKIR